MSAKRDRQRANGEQRVRPMRLVAATDPVLHGVALAEVPDPRWGVLAARLHATARLHNGMAVAAPQVGVSVRLVVLEDGLALLNPTVTQEAGGLVKGTEGCLTFPNRWYEVPRHRRVYVSGVHPVEGHGIGLWADDVQARMWQHEIDHLDGLVIDGRFPEIKDGHTEAWQDPIGDVKRWVNTFEEAYDAEHSGGA